MSSETPFNREDCIAVKKIKLIDTQYEDKDEFLKIHIHDYGDASIYIETLNDKKAFIESFPMYLMYQLKDFLNYALPEKHREFYITKTRS